MSGSDRRQQLLETALDFFSRKGFDGATTKEIAAAAGVTEAVIFRHFPSKQALYTAVLDYGTHTPELQDWLAETKACMDRNDDEGLMRMITANILKAYRKDPRLERVLLFAALEGTELGLEHKRSFSIPIAQLLCEYIARRQREGALRDDCQSFAILAAVGCMGQQWAMTTQMFGFNMPEITDELIVDNFTRILMNGIVKGSR